jgi:signal peptidase I
MKNIVDFVFSLPESQCIYAVAQTESMVPVIKKGQKIRIIKKPFSSVKVGNIIAYSKGRKMNILVHRVIGFVTHGKIKGCITKGDNLPQIDTYIIFKSNFIGIVM